LLVALLLGPRPTLARPVAEAHAEYTSGAKPVKPSDLLSRLALCVVALVAISSASLAQAPDNTSAANAAYQ